MKLNVITKDNAFPLPSIEELLIKVRESKFFTTLDLKSGYHQIPIDESSKEKTAFIANDQLFEYNYLPFGVKNAPAHFSRVMMSVLASLLGHSVFIYLDDIIIVGATVMEHRNNIIKVLEALKRRGMKINLEKCKFFQQEVEFLGHIVTPEGIKPCADKVAAIKEFPRPKTAKEVASFLGLAGYYRKFIKDFGRIARPLDLLRKQSDFHWGQEEEIAFQELKIALTSDELLAYRRFDRPFLVTTDASSVAIGGVISQIDDKGRERPICFASRALKGAKKNYRSFDREALAILWMLERHRYFLLGHKIQLQTDHRPLRDLFSKGDLTSRQPRWVERLFEFDIGGFNHTA